MYMNDKGFWRNNRGISLPRITVKPYGLFLYILYRLPHNALPVKCFLSFLKNLHNSCNSWNFRGSENHDKLTAPYFLYRGSCGSRDSLFEMTGGHRITLASRLRGHGRYRGILSRAGPWKYLGMSAHDKRQYSGAEKGKEVSIWWERLFVAIKTMQSNPRVTASTIIAGRFPVP